MPCKAMALKLSADFPFRSLDIHFPPAMSRTAARCSASIYMTTNSHAFQVKLELKLLTGLCNVSTSPIFCPCYPPTFISFSSGWITTYLFTQFTRRPPFTPPMDRSLVPVVSDPHPCDNGSGQRARTLFFASQICHARHKVDGSRLG